VWSVRVLLAADRELAGPPAWTWLRDAWLRENAAPGAADPLGTIELSWSAAGLSWQAAAAPPERGCYLQGTAELGPWTAWVAGDADGHEDWILDGPQPDDGRHPAAILGLRVGAVRHYDAGALIAALGVGGAMADPAVLLLAAASTACGETSVRCSRQEDGSLRIRGHGGGGLLLPAALAMIATACEGEPVVRPPAPTPSERWLLMAFASRGSYREEAVRQLTLTEDLNATATLQRLLFADEWVLVLAMRALGDRVARGGSDPAAILPRLAAAAGADLPDSIPMARAALAGLWPLADRTTRDRLLDSPAAAGLLPEAPPAAAAQRAAVDRPEEVAPTPGAWRWYAWSWVLLTSVGCFWWRQRFRSRAGFPQPQPTATIHQP